MNYLNPEITIIELKNGDIVTDSAIDLPDDCLKVEQ